MKNLITKISALVLAFFMLSTQICVLADDTAYVNGTQYQVQLSDNPWVISGSSTSAAQAVSVSVHYNGNVGIYKLYLPKLAAGQTIEEYKFRFTALKTSGDFRLIKLDDTGDAPSVASSGQIADRWGKNSTTWESYKANDGDLVSTLLGTIGTDNYYTITADLTAYAKECYNKGQSQFYVGIWNGSSTVKIYGNSVDSSFATAGIQTDIYPYYYFTLAAADSLALTASTPSNGSEDVTTDTAVSFTFNNGIKSAAVTINGEAVESSVSGTEVTVENYALSQVTDYIVTVDATDLYSQNVSETIYFSTGIDKTTAEVTEGESWSVTASAAPADLAANRTSIDIDTNKFAMYKMALPELGDRKLSSFKFTVGGNGSKSVALLKFMGTGWDMTTMKYDAETDSAAYAIISDWRTNGNNSQYYAVDSVSYTDSSNFNMTSDITSYAKECMNAGQEYMYIAAITTSTTNLYGFIDESINTSAKTYRAKFSYESITPELRSYNVTAAVSGSTLSALGFELLTDVDDFADYVEIRDTATLTPVAAALSYDAAARAVSLSSPAALAEETEYEVVIKSGTVDNYGNSISSDYVVTSFTTGKDIVTAPSKIVLSTEDVSDYSAAVHLSELNAANSYKFVSEISNNTSDDITLMLVLVKYDADNQVTGIAVDMAYTVAANTQDAIIESASLALDGSGSYVKAFVWNSSDLKPLADAVKSDITQ